MSSQHIIPKNPKLAGLCAEIRKLKLENQNLRAALEKDALSGLYSAQTLKKDLVKVFNELLETKESKFQPVYTLVFMDVDHFSSVNENYGHWAASRILSRLGKIIAMNIREQDKAYRYGGDEFVLLLNLDKQSAYQVAERLRQNIQDSVFGHKVQGQLKKIKITVSLGLQQLHEHDTVAGIIEQADVAMYQAKKESRNCVKMAA